jgi:hypothetical protein
MRAYSGSVGVIPLDELYSVCGLALDQERAGASNAVNPIEELPADRE